jgi:hypothetical protein
MRVRRIGDRSGANNPNWRGGIRKLGHYYYVQQKHPRAVLFGQTPYVMRAVVNLEKKIGRRLRKGELAHHEDGNKTNDSPRNLKIETKADHNRIHSAGKSNEERARVKRITDKLPDKGSE